MRDTDETRHLLLAYIIRQRFGESGRSRASLFNSGVGRLRGRGFRLCFSRPADSEEKQVGHEYLRSVREKLKAGGTEWEQLPHAAWSSYLRVLLGSDEFFYID